ALNYVKNDHATGKCANTTVTASRGRMQAGLLFITNGRIVCLLVTDLRRLITKLHGIGNTHTYCSEHVMDGAIFFYCQFGGFLRFSKVNYPFKFKCKVYRSECLGNRLAPLALHVDV